MTDWFRSWHGAPTDPKWLAIAKRAGVAPGIVVAVAWSLMDRASQSADRGSIAGYDAEALAAFFGCEPEQVDGIVAAMAAKGMIDGDRLTSWEKRQPRREDDSSQRVREHRERAKQQVERDVTQRNAPETEVDTDIEPSSLRSDGGARARRANPILILQSEVDPVAAQRWVTHCEDKGKKPSAAQAEELCGVLREVKRQGGNATEALSFAIRKGWVSVEVEYLRNGGFHFATPAAPTEDWAARMEVWRANQTWAPGWGPKPGDPNCRVPAELLKRAA